MCKHRASSAKHDYAGFAALPVTPVRRSCTGNVHELETRLTLRWPSGICDCLVGRLFCPSPRAQRKRRTRLKAFSLARLLFDRLTLAAA